MVLIIFLSNVYGLFWQNHWVWFTVIFCSTGTIPDAWRTANITPVHKKGVSLHVTNYRPISLTSLFCKIFERIVKQQLLTYLQSNELITQEQYGFLFKSSTSAQLLDCINVWTLSFRKRYSVILILPRHLTLLTIPNLFTNCEFMVFVRLCLMYYVIF